MADTADSFAFDLGSADSYSFWSDVTLRFSDEDRMGHINNCAYTTFFEAVRVAYIDSFHEAGRIDTVLVNLNIDYRRETRFPGTIAVGARLGRAGNTSFSAGYGVFRDGECLATCVATNVFFDVELRKATAPPQVTRAAMLALMSASTPAR